MHSCQSICISYANLTSILFKIHIIISHADGGLSIRAWGKVFKLGQKQTGK